MENIKQYDKILVLDFGSQYNQLISRRVREKNVYSLLVSRNITPKEILEYGNVKGIIFSGGPNSVLDKGSFDCDQGIYDLGIPILGICYGMQLIAKRANGDIGLSGKREYGKAEVTILGESTLFNRTPKKQNVWMSHGNHVDALDKRFTIVASSADCPIIAFENDQEKLYGVQFHPEVRNSDYGLKLLDNFIFDICGAKPEWKMENVVNYMIEDMRNRVGSSNVLLGLSGGVDSSVVAALLSKAIGKQLTAMFIDNGLLRKGEREQVIETFSKVDMNFVCIDAKDRFLSKLKGISDPEEKRKIIGNEFVYIFDEESKKLGQFEFLAQGTLYTDIIESGTDTAETIKSHHNVGGLPDDMEFKLLEPLNNLFKDEARYLGEALDVPKEIVWRQPFPGPGLGIRVLGEVTEDKLKIVRDSDYILREEIKRAGLDSEVWQYFTALPNMKSVGVMGDQRTYDYTVGIRAVTSIDGMTADWAKLPWDVLETISRRIVNEVSNVNRIVYDITSKPPATIEWE